MYRIESMQSIHMRMKDNIGSTIYVLYIGDGGWCNHFKLEILITEGAFFTHHACLKSRLLQDVCACQSAVSIKWISGEKRSSMNGCLEVFHIQDLICIILESIRFVQRHFQESRMIVKAFPEIVNPEIGELCVNSCSLDLELQKSKPISLLKRLVRHGRCRPFEMEVTCGLDSTHGHAGTEPISLPATCCAEWLCGSLCRWRCSNTGMLEQRTDWKLSWCSLYQPHGPDFQPWVLVSWFTFLAYVNHVSICQFPWIGTIICVIVPVWGWSAVRFGTQGLVAYVFLGFAATASQRCGLAELCGWFFWLQLCCNRFPNVHLYLPVLAAS